MKTLKIIGMCCLFTGILVQVLWGFFGNAWAVSWVASFVGVMLMCIMNVIAKNSGSDKKDQ